MARFFLDPLPDPPPCGGRGTAPRLLSPPAARRLVVGFGGCARLGAWSRRTEVGRTVWARLFRAFAFRSVPPAPLRGAIVPIVASAARRDLQVLPEPLHSRFHP